MLVEFFLRPPNKSIPAEDISVAEIFVHPWAPRGHAITLETILARSHQIPYHGEAACSAKGFGPYSDHALARGRAVDTGVADERDVLRRPGVSGAKLEYKTVPRERSFVAVGEEHVIAKQNSFHVVAVRDAPCVRVCLFVSGDDLDTWDTRYVVHFASWVKDSLQNS